jgi:hypothetical protein
MRGRVGRGAIRNDGIIRIAYHRMHSHRAMRIVRASICVLLASIIVAGCSWSGKPKPAETVDPNAYPANYRTQIVTLLTTLLTDRADFRGALIAPPALKPVGQSQHYVVCLQLNGHNQHKDKVVIYLAGVPTQYIDSKPEQCADAAYQPFKELEDMTPTR